MVCFGYAALTVRCRHLVAALRLILSRKQMIEISNREDEDELELRSILCRMTVEFYWQTK